MDAVMSGRAGALAFIVGDRCELLHGRFDTDPKRVEFGHLKYVFSDVDDLLVLRRTSREEASRAFTDQLRADEAVRLALILLDDSEATDLREEAVAMLTTVLEQRGIRDSIKNCLLSAPMPANVNLGDALAIAKRSPPVAELLWQVESSSRSVAQVYDAWRSLDDELFEAGLSRDAVFSRARQRGAVRLLVESIEAEGKGVDAAVFELLQALRDIPNYRTIVSEWTSRFRERSREGREIERLAELHAASEDYETEEEVRGVSDRGYGAFTRVMAQQDAIKANLRSGNVALATKFAQDLIENQVSSGNPELAAKSLCNLAQEANAVGQFSVQLEWAKAAAELSPSDSVTHGHVADAYIFLQRYDDALAALRNVEELGDPRFAGTERARILRLQGRFEDALDAYADVKHLYGAVPENAYAWNGYAEVLRDLRRFDRALAAYDEAIKCFPNEMASLCGKAGVLADLGLLENALGVHEYVIGLGGNTLVAQMGKAFIHKQMGLLDAALALYGRVRESNPGFSPAAVGMATVLRLMHRYHDAMKILRHVRRRFPYDSSAVSEIVEVYRDQSMYEQALEVVNSEGKKFPMDVRLTNTRALVYKDMGMLREALRIFDENVTKFPYDFVSRQGRADTLKRLRYLDEAVNAYDDIIDRWPEEIGAKNAKAAVLVAADKLEDAERLISNDVPRTAQEWLGTHVRGMILMKRGKIEEAIAHFERCVQNVPFAKQKAYFQNALALCHLKRNSYEEALAALPEYFTPMSNVIVLHTYALSGDRNKANETLERIDRSRGAEIIELSGEIARRFGVRGAGSQHDEEWILRQELNSVLLEAA